MVALYLLLDDTHWMFREWKHESLSDVFGVSCFVDENWSSKKLRKILGKPRRNCWTLVPRRALSTSGREHY